MGLFVGIRGVEDITPDYLREDVTPEHPITHSSKKGLMFSRNDGMNERYIRIISHFFYPGHLLSHGRQQREDSPGGSDFTALNLQVTRYLSIWI